MSESERNRPVNVPSTEHPPDPGAGHHPVGHRPGRARSRGDGGPRRRGHPRRAVLRRGAAAPCASASAGSGVARRLSSCRSEGLPTGWARAPGPRSGPASAQRPSRPRTRRDRGPWRRVQMAGSTSVHASLAALAAPAPACGRGVTAASPTRATRPCTSAGGSASLMTVTNGACAARTTNAAPDMHGRGAATSRASLRGRLTNPDLDQ
jgi:hypothetical protein